MIPAAAIGAVATLGSQAMANSQNQMNAAANMLYNHFEAKAQRNWASKEAATAREFNAQQAQLERDYAERMSNTAVQRKMVDLKKAGINPLLAATEGASVPSAGAAKASMPVGSSASVAPMQVAHGANLMSFRDDSVTREQLLREISSSANVANYADWRNEEFGRVRKRDRFISAMAEEVSHSAAQDLLNLMKKGR